MALLKTKDVCEQVSVAPLQEKPGEHIPETVQYEVLPYEHDADNDPVPSVTVLSTVETPPSDIEGTANPDQVVAAQPTDPGFEPSKRAPVKLHEDASFTRPDTEPERPVG